MGSESYNEATALSHLNKGRLLVLIGGVAVVLFDATIVWLYPDEPALSGLRYLCALTGMVFFVSSYFSAHVRRYSNAYLIVVIAVYNMVWAYNLILSEFSLPIILSQFNVVVGCSAVLRERREVASYLTLVAVAGTLGVYALDLSPAFSLIYMITFFTLCGLCYVTLNTMIGKQRDLHQSQTVLASIIDESPDALWLGTADGKRQANNHLGVALQPTIVDLLCQIDAGQLGDCQKQGNQWQLETPVTTVQGFQFWGDVWIRQLPADEQQTANIYLVRISDITERREAADALRHAKAVAEEALETRSRFLANMSHEIRTPMNGVIGMTSLLAETKLDPDQQQFVKTVQTSGEALMAIINDILDFSKIDAGELEMEHQTFAVEQCVGEAAELMAALAHEKAIELVYTIDADVPRLCIGDMSRLRQVLLNLLSNAIKFTPEGEVKLTVSYQPGAQDSPAGSGQLHFTVDDTGIGIDPKSQDQLFQPFTQADNSTTRVYGGTGLGLAICRQLVELMGGEIKVSSTQGKGSSFHFFVTIIIIPEDSDMPSDLSGIRALVVDDNQTNLDVLEAILSRQGISTSQFDNPEDALAHYAGETFDVAVLDFNMPQMDGVTLAEELESIRPIPKILLSSNALGGDPHLFDARINKPIRPSTLLTNLRAVMGQQAIQEQNPHQTNSPGELKHLKVLVAEDNPVNQLVIQKILQRLSITADLAKNGREAVQMCKNKNYDVVLMDIQMPVMDGLSATRAIMAEHSHHPHIIALTANAMPADQEKCLQAGMHHYMSKPVNVEQLQQHLRHLSSAPG